MSIRYRRILIFSLALLLALLLAIFLCERVLAPGRASVLNAVVIFLHWNLSFFSFVYALAA